MDNGPSRSRTGWLLAAWTLLALSPAALADGPVAQRIGELSGPLAEALGAEVTVVPFSPSLDPGTTPLILAPGKAFIERDGRTVGGLEPAESQALERAYAAGQVILVPDAGRHDIAALHQLLGKGVAYTSATDPVVLAYALRQEHRIPTARVVTYPVRGERETGRFRPAGPDGSALLDEDVIASRQALGVVVEELTRPPAAPAPPGGSTDWGSSPVQEFILTSTDRGTYNTPIELFALHSCAKGADYFLVNTGGTWTPERAQYASADRDAGQLRLDGSQNLVVDWQNGSDAACTAGIDVFGGARRICGYFNYPMYYEVGIAPPPAPATVIQVNAAPAADQGQSTSYTSGFTFSIGGGVDVSGEGASGGFQAGVSWDNSVSTTVPALVVQAGNEGNQGTFTRYRYCTSGSNVNCTSSIQMTGAQGACQGFVVGQPQPGQTPNGRLSNVTQTVNWQVDPATYGATFDVTVTFVASLANSVSKLWNGQFQPPVFRHPGAGPFGMCNTFGCSCDIATTVPAPVQLSYTFKVPRPSTKCTAGAATAAPSP